MVFGWLVKEDLPNCTLLTSYRYSAFGSKATQRLGIFIDVARITTKRKVQEPDDVTDANNDDDEEDDVDETGVAWSVM
jgi:hypothetical protein